MISIPLVVEGITLLEIEVVVENPPHAFCITHGLFGAVRKGSREIIRIFLEQLWLELRKLSQEDGVEENRDIYWRDHAFNFVALF